MIHKHRIIVVARGLEDNRVIPFCKAIYDGGIRLVEFPFDHCSQNKLTETARKIAAVKEHFGDKLLVGAGTVLTEAEVDAAVDAGASYIISPSFDGLVVKRAKERGVAAFPGAMTPTEIQNAYLSGAHMVKIFPTNILGIEYLKAISAPLSHIEMIAMGGVDKSNIKEFLKVCKAVGIGAGICNKKLIDEGNFAEITRLARAHTSQVEEM